MKHLRCTLRTVTVLNVIIICPWSYLVSRRFLFHEVQRIETLFWPCNRTINSVSYISPSKVCRSGIIDAQWIAKASMLSRIPCWRNHRQWPSSASIALLANPMGTFSWGPHERRGTPGQQRIKSLLKFSVLMRAPLTPPSEHLPPKEFLAHQRPKGEAVPCDLTAELTKWRNWPPN